MDDLDLQAVGPADLLQGRRVAAVAPPEAHVVPHDHGAGPEQLLQPPAHESVRALLGEVKGVVDHEHGVQPRGGQQLQAVSQ